MPCCGMDWWSASQNCNRIMGDCVQYSVGGWKDGRWMACGAGKVIDFQSDSKIETEWVERGRAGQGRRDVSAASLRRLLLRTVCQQQRVGGQNDGKRDAMRRRLTRRGSGHNEGSMKQQDTLNSRSGMNELIKFNIADYTAIFFIYGYQIIFYSLAVKRRMLCGGAMEKLSQRRGRGVSGSGWLSFAGGCEKQRQRVNQ